MVHYLTFDGYFLPPTTHTDITFPLMTRENTFVQMKECVDMFATIYTRFPECECQKAGRLQNIKGLVHNVIKNVNIAIAKRKKNTDRASWTQGMILAEKKEMALLGKARHFVPKIVRKLADLKEKHNLITCTHFSDDDHRRIFEPDDGTANADSTE